MMFLLYQYPYKTEKFVILKYVKDSEDFDYETVCLYPYLP